MAEVLAASSSAAARVTTTTRSLPTAATTSSPASTPTVTNQRLSSLSFSTKIGVGVGIPLSVIILLLTRSLVFRYWRNEQDSRAQHHGNTLAAGTNTAGDDGEAGVAATKNGVTVKESKHDVNGNDVALNDNAIRAKELEYDTEVGADTKLAHEVHIEGLPAYSKELPGSPGVSRQKLPVRRRSA